MKKVILAPCILLMFGSAVIVDQTPVTVTEDVTGAQAVMTEPVEDRTRVDETLPCMAPESAAQLVAAAYECPPSSAYCQFDRQCDNQCGAGAGSCFNGCCYCAF